ncbi:MAG TPA: lytic transglycosylase F [Myxococcales bacterium]|nr:lytic transglycosylase F [Myxococcales bacterium]
MCAAVLVWPATVRADAAPTSAPPTAKPASHATANFETFREHAAAPVFDDLDGLLARGKIRVAVTYSKTHFFVDKGNQRGFAYENLIEFERFLRERHRRNRRAPVSIVFMPVPRNELFNRLRDGRADLAVANLTITPERKELADFTVPLYSGAREVLVTASHVQPMTSLDDLSGRDVVVRGSSSFREHLDALNERLTAAGKAPVQVEQADEHLETEDLLEMVSAGLIEATMADDYIAELWKEIFPNLQIHGQAPIAEGTSIAWAVRKGAPKLLAEANAFLATHRSGTTFGNVLRTRYLKDTHWARRAMDEHEVEKFDSMVKLFQQYGERYRFDYLLILAQAYQESKLDQNRRSPAGAIGVMQVLPQTGAQMKVGDIRTLEPNVHAGVKYLRSVIEKYFSDPAIGDLDRTLFAFAAYNAGPRRIQSLRKKAAASGLDANVWFANVEAIASQVMGMETVHYVSNISKYYLAYRMIENRRHERKEARE